ncbi:Gldg family protein [Pedobacter antarcticus]|uniref:Gldg family protein n=1 Tax=Pedobacter antarcticus TaxID=34086 RepID=UPI00292E92C5|nr:Gldg family protein [Pedobacter antarcticus]
MKTTLKIAKLELNILFYSPIAWLLSIVFLFQCGLFYTSAIQDLFTNQQIGGSQLQLLNFSTNTVFGLARGLFGDVLRKIYLYLPLLTMGLISREISSGTIKLLYSSPVKVSEIILGKFVAMMAYNLVLIGILCIFVFTGTLNIKAAELGTMFSGLLGIYFLLCAYAAIGLFMSSLTSYQVVAAIGTLAIFAILNYIGKVWQNLDFVRDLTNFISISYRAERMIFGLMATSDIAYFLLIISIFLGFAHTRLQSGRQSKPGYYVAARYLAIFFIALMVGYVASLPGMIGYYDATPGKRNTLTLNAQKIIAEFGEEPLEIISYINLLDQRWYVGKPDQRNNLMVGWAPYLRFKPNIKFKFIYYWDVPTPEPYEFYPGKTLKEIAQQIALSWKMDFKDFKTPEEIKKIIDLKGEQNRFVMQLKYKDRTTFLRLYDDPSIWPSETEISAAFRRLQLKLPKIVFAQGEFERNIYKFGWGDKSYGIPVSMISNRTSLINQGFDIDTVSLQTQEIPEDITALVIADPRKNFSPQAVARIQKYIQRGGNLMIAGEPDKKAILNPVLQPLGLQFAEGMLMQKSKDNSPDVVIPVLTKNANSFSKSLNEYFRERAGVRMPGAAGLVTTGNTSFTISPLLATDPQLSWNKKGKLVLDSADITYSPESGDEKKPFPTAVGLTRILNGKEQRIAVTGDADFMSSAEMYRQSYANAPFTLSVFGWFTHGQFPIDTSRPESSDNQLHLTSKGLTALKVLFLGILPGAVVMFSTIFLIRRKRK